MTEDEARQWVVDRFGAAAAERLAAFGALVAQETTRQNLIAPSTVATIWTRHLLDSAQLVPLAPARATRWIDIGTGAGFPGMVVALLFDGAVTLVEPRARRAAFLRAAAAALGCACEVQQCRAEMISGAVFDVISARAVATIDALFAMTDRMRHQSTRLVLPRGRSGADEMNATKQGWRGMFHVEQSLTDPASLIVVADRVARR